MSDVYGADPWAAFPDAKSAVAPAIAPVASGGDPWSAFPDAREGAKPEPSGLSNIWPVRVGREIASAAISAATAPGEAYSGKLRMTDPETGQTSQEAIGRASDMAMFATPVNPAVRAGDYAIAGTARRPPITPSGEAASAAERVGVDLPKAIATDSPLVRFMGQVTSKLPGGGPMLERTRGAVEQTGEAVGRASDLAGGTADAAAAGAGYKGAIEGYFKPAVKARVGAAYDAVERLVDPMVTQQLDATQGAIADITARRMASGTDDIGKAVQTVLGGATRPGGLTFAGVKDLRTRVGEMLDTGIFPEGMSQHELRRIYGALSDDLKSAALSAGGDKAVAALERANNLHKVVEGWKDQLQKVLGQGEGRPAEGVTASILRAASEGPSGNVQALAMARAAVPKEVWQDVASTAVSQLGKDRKGQFSPAMFLNDFAAMSERGKNLLFGAIGSRDVIPYLNDIAKVSQKFVEAGKLANTSGTAGHSAAYTAIGGAAVGVMHGSLIEPMTAIGGIIGNNLLARALSQKATAASMARWSRTYDALASNPSAATLSAFNLAGRNLANTIQGTLGERVNPADFMRAIQGSVGARPEGQPGLSGQPMQQDQQQGGPQGMGPFNQQPYPYRPGIDA